MLSNKYVHPNCQWMNGIVWDKTFSICGGQTSQMGHWDWCNISEGEFYCSGENTYRQY